MATFRFVHCATGLPLHIDGCGDKLASVRYGDCSLAAVGGFCQGIPSGSSEGHRFLSVFF
jgi:hypothetical protein